MRKWNEGFMIMIYERYNYLAKLAIHHPAEKKQVKSSRSEESLTSSIGILLFRLVSVNGTKSKFRNYVQAAVASLFLLYGQSPMLAYFDIPSFMAVIEPTRNDLPMACLQQCRSYTCKNMQQFMS